MLIRLQTSKIKLVTSRAVNVYIKIILYIPIFILLFIFFEKNKVQKIKIGVIMKMYPTKDKESCKHITTSMYLKVCTFYIKQSPYMISSSS